MLRRLQALLDPDLALPPAARDELHAADRAYNAAIARRWWGWAAAGICVVALGFSRVKPSGAAEVLWLRNATAVNAALSATYVALCLCAHLDRGAARAVTRHAGALGVGAALLGYALIGVNAQRVTGAVGYFIGFVVVTPVLMRLRAPVFMAMALPSSALLLAGVAALQRSPTLRSTNLVLVFAMTAYAMANSRIFRAATVREAAQRRELARFNDELAARVDERTRDLRALATRLDEVIETERRRLARELHDDLGQELTALRLEIDTRRAHARDGDLASLDRMAAGVQRAHDGVRAILESLRPRILDEEGLDAAIRWLAGRLQERAGWACELDLRLAAPVDDATALVAFRIAQEALTNTAKHASAARVAVSLASEGGWLSLTIHDDGPRGGGAVTPGRGLTGMLERALSVGGELRVTPGSPSGTTVHARLPLRAATADAPPA